MRLPGFGAESTFYKTSSGYQTGRRPEIAGGLVPSQVRPLCGPFVCGPCSNASGTCQKECSAECADGRIITEFEPCPAGSCVTTPTCCPVGCVVCS